MNSVTHGLGAGLALVGLAVLLFLAVSTRDVWRIVGCGVYGVTLVMLYTASTLYHSLRKPRVKRWMKVLDHSCIYLLIAGTYTPFTLVPLRGPWGWSLLGIVWGLALAGLIFKILFVDRYPAFSLTLYLLMGWLAVVAVKPLMESVPVASLAWIVIGGLLYSGGLLFYMSERKLRYGHAVWHVFVLLGSTCHYVAVLLCIVLTAAG